MKRALCLFLMLIMFASVGCVAQETEETKVLLSPFVTTVTDSFGKSIDEWFGSYDSSHFDIHNQLLASLAYDINATYPNRFSFNTGNMITMGKSRDALHVYFPISDTALHITYMPGAEFSVFEHLDAVKTDEEVMDYLLRFGCEEMVSSDFPWDMALKKVYAQASKLNSQEPTDGSYRELKPGCKGQDVLAARTKMYELGYFKNKPKQTEYTENMMEYVKRFEKDYGLKQDGILSPEDQEVLFAQ